MPEGQLFLVSANKSRIGNLEWSDDDYDVREGAPDGPVVGRIYKLSVAPTGNWWFWAVQLFRAVGRWKNFGRRSAFIGPIHLPTWPARPCRDAVFVRFAKRSRPLRALRHCKASLVGCGGYRSHTTRGFSLVLPMRSLPEGFVLSTRPSRTTSSAYRYQFRLSAMRKRDREPPGFT